MALRTAGQSKGDSDAPEDIVAEINITPLTDIFLVLLIIFMVTSSVMSQMGVEVKLPQASQGTAGSQPEGVIVTLLPDGRLKVNGETVDRGDYEAMKKKLGVELPKAKAKMVILEGDRRAFLGNAIEVMDHARKAGAETFAIATTGESANDAGSTPQR